MNILSGYKTYIVAAAIIVYAAAEFWSGAMTQQAAVEFVLNGLGLGALRAGVAKVGA